MTTTIRRGTIVSFDTTTWKALVMLDGSLAEVKMAVGEWVPGSSLAADDQVAVLLFADTNQEDGVILGPFGSVPPGDFTQAETAAPATPASGFLRWFADSTQSWGCFVNDAGAVVPVGTARVNLPLLAGELAAATVVQVQTHHTALSCADAATQGAYWSVKLPPGWADRSIQVHILWAPSTTNTGNCVWFLFLYRQADGVTLSSTAEEETNVIPAANGVADRAQATSFPALSLADFAEGESMSVRIVRGGANALDTFTGAARLLAVELSIVG